MMDPLHRMPTFAKVRFKLKYPAERCYKLSAEALERFTAGSAVAKQMEEEFRRDREENSQDNWIRIELVHQSFFMELGRFGFHIYGLGSREAVGFQQHIMIDAWSPHKKLVSLNLTDWLENKDWQNPKYERELSVTLYIVFLFIYYLSRMDSRETFRRDFESLGTHMVERQGETFVYKRVYTNPVGHNNEPPVEAGPIGHTTAKKIEHEVRGHWRTLRNGNRTRVRNHKRDDPTIGHQTTIMEFN